MRFHYTATASCSYDQCIAFRVLEIAEKSKPGNEIEAFMLPEDRKMNSDRVLFGSLAYAVQFCGFQSEYISHLSRIWMIQRKVCYSVPGAACRTTGDIARPGVMCIGSWPGGTRMHLWVLPEKVSDQVGNENANEEDKDVFGIDLWGDELAYIE